jgi:3-oxoacyl-(acyl-carrier-protein) synthase
MTAVDIHTYAVSDAPADLLGRAREVTPRRVLRLLDALSFPAVIAVAELKEAGWPTGWPEERTGLITISGIEPTVPQMPSENDESDYLREIFTLVQTRKPTEWLRQMANNATCQAAITTRLLGPSIHFVGTGDTCRSALAVATVWLESGAADAVLVVAFDYGAGGLASDGRVQAAGVAITRAGRASAPAWDTADLIMAAVGGTAVEAMCGLVSAIRAVRDGETDRDG